MSLETTDLERIATLAKLIISPTEMSAVSEKLNDTLALIKRIDAINTTDILPLSSPLEDTQPLRQDKVTESNHREAFQHIAPLAKHGLYLVPQVIESE